MLGENLQRLTISNEALSVSNKTLVDILSARQQGPNHVDAGLTTTSSSREASLLDDPHGNSLDSCSSVTNASSNNPLIHQEAPSHPMHNHLQRCMDSVQELARTIACSMSTWQGHDKTGNSDIHGSHAKLVAELRKLPAELECERCSGRVPWAHFDPASRCLGTCTCVGQTSPIHWKARGTTDPVGDWRRNFIRTLRHTNAAITVTSKYTCRGISLHDAIASSDELRH